MPHLSTVTSCGWMWKRAIQTCVMHVIQNNKYQNKLLIPKAGGHLNVTPVCDCWTFNSTTMHYASSLKAFRNILQPGCSSLLPFSHKIISGTGHWCRAVRPGWQSVFQFISGVLTGLRSGLCAGQARSSTPDVIKHLFMDQALSCWKTKLLPQHCKHNIFQNMIACCNIKISLNWN